MCVIDHQTVKKASNIKHNVGKKQYKGNTQHRETLPKGIINILRGKVTKTTTTKKDNKGALEILKYIYSRKEKLIRKRKVMLRKYPKRKAKRW